MNPDKSKFQTEDKWLSIYLSIYRNDSFERCIPDTRRSKENPLKRNDRSSISNTVKGVYLMNTLEGINFMSHLAPRPGRLDSVALWYADSADRMLPRAAKV